MPKQHSERAHSTVGASSASRWFACPGSVRLSVDAPNKASAYAEEGTAAHEMAEYCLTTGVWDAHSRDAKEHINWTQDAADAVQVYLDTVYEARVTAGDGHELEIETRFQLHLIDPDAYGTNDAMVYSPTQKKLTIIDYKHGAGVPVEAEGNKQLLYYALGAATAKHNRPLETVEMIIVQPRCEHPDGYVRRWTVDLDYLLDWSGDLAEAIARTKDPEAPLVSGDHCRWCPAKGFCPQYRDDAYDAARLEFSHPSEMSPADLAGFLDRANMMESWIRDVRAYAYEQAMAGIPPMGFKLVAKRASRKWVDEKGATLFMKKRGHVDEEIFKMEIKSPAQLEKLLNKTDREFLDTFIVKESSGLTLAPAADKRSAVTPDAASDFE